MPDKARQPRRRRAVVIVAAVAAVMALTALGAWQVHRLQWKRDLIARIEQGLAGKPVTITDIEAGIEHGYDVDWLKATATGYYAYGHERFVYTIHDGKPAWRVITPLIAFGDYVILVDRGVVPDDRRDPRTRPSSRIPPALSRADALKAAGNLPAPLTVTGVIRVHAAAKPLFAAANDVSANRWYWVDIAGLYRSLPGDIGTLDANRPARYLPVVLQIIPGGEPGHGEFPIILEPKVDIPNKHLGYAITWFALALVAAVFGVLLARRG